MSTSPRTSRFVRAGALVSFGAPLAVYLLTLGPWLYWRDTPEFSLVPFLLDICHPPGSPTYTLLGKLASFLPLGSVSLRANLLSAGMGALASLAVYGLVLRAAFLVASGTAEDSWFAPLAAATCSRR